MLYKCYNCNEMGHYACDCLEPKRKDFKLKGNKKEINYTDNVEDTFIF